MRLPLSARILATIGLGLLCARTASAQQRPLTTEDPEVIGAGRVLVEAGVESGQNARYFLSGLKGDRVATPVGVSVAPSGSARPRSTVLVVRVSSGSVISIPPEDLSMAGGRLRRPRA